MHHRRLTAAVVIASLAIAGACTSAPSPTPDPTAFGQAAERTDMADRRLDVTSAVSDGTDILPAGDYIQIALQGHGQFDVNGAGCHYAFGNWDLEAGRLLVANVEATSVGCGPVRDDRDWWFVQLLADQPSIRIDDTTVTMTAADTVVTLVDHAEPASWRVDPAHDLTPDSRTLHLLVTEAACASGRSPEGRILEPVVSYGPDSIEVTVRIKSLVSANCIGNGPHPLKVELAEPVGKRLLVNGAERMRGPEVAPTPGP